MSAPIETAWHAIGDERVRVHAAGSGPVVVLIHGLGLSADFWRYHVERIGAAGFRVIAPDMPGFGKSPGPAFGFTVEHAAAWCAQFADTLALRDAIWVGHSISSQYVLRLAVDRPDLVAGLVLAAPTGEPGMLRWFFQLVSLARNAFRERLPFVGRVLGHYLTTPPTRFVGSWLAARRHLALPDAPAVAAPVRIVLGSRDPIVPRAFVDRLLALAPDASLEIIDGSAHGVALSPAEPFCRVVLDFARSIFPRDPVDNSPERRGNRVETP